LIIQSLPIWNQFGISNSLHGGGIYIFCNYTFIVLYYFSEELAKEKLRLKGTQEEAKKLRNELQRVLAEGDGYRVAAALAESSQREELEKLRANYQEEITSFQAIMSGKVL